MVRSLDETAGIRDDRVAETLARGRACRSRILGWPTPASRGTLASMSDGESARLLRAIAVALEPLEEVRAALLFGSRATGHARAASDVDVDVAVLLRDQPGQLEAKGQLQRLLAALTDQLAADRVDVVILNDAPLALAFRALKHGQVAFERDPRDLLRFRVRTYSLHADYARVERFFNEVIKNRALSMSRG
jgi:uncharacterized protein